ncbi:hypothetical protein AK812_SmicGene41196 [Symbiodinium microadriaticum]|uniref:Uncharacterized protein n=1 Tax=Symbiodinium microadriaticum TaxID=2951 RepID=A0A1Q9C6V2_SYMMI|nr:hypothetical protein AK812_SmicGene41196 [Symbiodinium microadriaticum]
MRTCGCSKVISEGTMWLATPASRCSEWEWQAQGGGGGIHFPQKGSLAEAIDGGRGTLPATSVVNLGLVLDERTRLFSMEQVVPGRVFKSNGGQRVAGNLRWQCLRQLACCVEVRDKCDRRRLDLVVYGALSSGGAQCCDATLVSPLSRLRRGGCSWAQRRLR